MSERVTNLLDRIIPMLIVISLLSPLSAAQATDGFVALFDGKTLDGWQVEYSRDNNFSAEHGVIVAKGPGGWLHTIRKYSDFRLKVEFRFVSPDGSGNSGIYIRTPDNSITGRPPRYPGDSFEIELRDMTLSKAPSPPWMGNLLRLGNAPLGETVFDSEAALKAYKKTGEWQTCEIEAAGERLLVWLNGLLVTRAYGVAYPDGSIGLEGETGVVEFRAVQIKEL